MNGVLLARLVLTAPLMERRACAFVMARSAGPVITGVVTAALEAAVAAVADATARRPAAGNRGRSAAIVMFQRCAPLPRSARRSAATDAIASYPMCQSDVTVRYVDRADLTEEVLRRSPGFSAALSAR